MRTEIRAHNRPKKKDVFFTTRRQVRISRSVPDQIPDQILIRNWPFLAGGSLTRESGVPYCELPRLLSGTPVPAL